MMAPADTVGCACLSLLQASRHSWLLFMYISSTTLLVSTIWRWRRDSLPMNDSACLSFLAASNRSFSCLMLTALLDAMATAALSEGLFVFPHHQFFFFYE